jgi:hypothetical protein
VVVAGQELDSTGAREERTQPQKKIYRDYVNAYGDASVLTQNGLHVPNVCFHLHYQYKLNASIQTVHLITDSETHPKPLASLAQPSSPTSSHPT